MVLLRKSRNSGHAEGRVLGRALWWALSRWHKDRWVCDACNYVKVILSHEGPVVPCNRLPDPDGYAPCSRERAGPLRLGRVQRPDRTFSSRIIIRNNGNQR